MLWDFAILAYSRPHFFIATEKIHGVGDNFVFLAIKQSGLKKKPKPKPRNRFQIQNDE